MMGRQVNYYLSDRDQEEFCQRLNSLGGVSAIMPPLSKPTVEGQAIATFARWRPGEHDPVLFRSVDTAKLVFRRSVAGYFIDDMRSPVVEFSRCATTNDTIRRGRLYYIAGYFDDENRKIAKDAHFIDWAKEVFKILKRICVENRNGILIGREAQSMGHLGYRFECQ